MFTTRTRGRRLGGSIVLATGLLAASFGGAAAATGPIGDKSYSESGLTAQANSTTCTEDGAILSCTDIEFGAFVGKLKDGASPVTHVNQVCVAVGTWSFDQSTGEDVGVPVYERGCAVDLPNGTIQVDTKLGSAVVATTTLTIEQLECSKEACIPGPSRQVSIAASWIGTGSISSQKHHASGDDGTCRYSESFKGAGRSASFAGSIGEVSFTTDDLGYLSSGQLSFRSRCDEG